MKHHNEKGCGPHGHHGEVGEHGRRGGGRRQRFFGHGELRLVILDILTRNASHGYELIKAIETMTQGNYSPSPGVIYPTLTLLDDMGLVAPTDSDGAKKLFEITDLGRAELDPNRKAIDALIARLTAVGEEHRRTDSASVRRAMGNLRAVLMNRLGDRDLDEAALHDIVALIDEAAQKIERLG